MARIRSGSVLRGYRVDGGQSWCEALIARLKEYEEHSEVVEFSELEQRSLTALVEVHMLKVKLEERESRRPAAWNGGRFVPVGTLLSLRTAMGLIQRRG